MTHRSLAVRTATIALIAAVLLGVMKYALFARPMAPEIEFNLLDGTRTSTQALRGKVIYVNFCATSCATCIKEMPEGVRIYRLFAPRKFDLIAVAMSYDPPEYVRNYAARQQLPFKVALDTDGAIARAFDDVNLTPTAILVDKNGKLLRRIVGEPDFRALAALIEEEIEQ